MLWSAWGESVQAEVGGDEDAGVLWVDSGSASVFGNPVLWTRPVAAANVGAIVRRQAEAFSRRSGAPYLLYSAFPTPGLSEHGLQPVGHPPCMVRVPGLASETPRAPSGFSVRRVESVEQLNDFERMLVEAYPIPDLLPWSPGVFLGGKLTARPNWHLFVGYVDGTPVATAAAYDTEHAVAVDRSRPALLLASDDGQPVYRAMGFRALTRFSLWIGPRQQVSGF